MNSSTVVYLKWENMDDRNIECFNKLLEVCRRTDAGRWIGPKSGAMNSTRYLSNVSQASNITSA